MRGRSRRVAPVTLGALAIALGGVLLARTTHVLRPAPVVITPPSEVASVAARARVPAPVVSSSAVTVVYPPSSAQVDTANCTPPPWPHMVQPRNAHGYEWSPDGALLAVHYDDAVRLWRFPERKLERVLPQEVSGPFRSDGRALLSYRTRPTGLAYASPDVWDLTTSTTRPLLPSPIEFEDAERLYFWISPSYRWFVHRSEGETLVRDTATGEVRYRLVAPEQATIESLFWRPDEELIATLDSLGHVGVWDAFSGALRQRWRPPEIEQIETMAWLADGSALMIEGTQGKGPHGGPRILHVQQWKTEPRRMLDHRKLKAHWNRLAGWSPDGRFLFFEDDHAFHRLDRTTGERHTLDVDREEEHTMSYQNPRVSPDGRWVVTHHAYMGPTLLSVFDNTTGRPIEFPVPCEFLRVYPLTP